MPRSPNVENKNQKFVVSFFNQEIIIVDLLGYLFLLQYSLMERPTATRKEFINRVQDRAGNIEAREREREREREH